MCKILHTIFRGLVRVWYNNLESGLVTNFSNLYAKLVANFSTSILAKKSSIKPFEITQTIVIKPELVRQFNPGPRRPGGWTSPGNEKDQDTQKPSETRLTRDSGDSAKPG